MVGHMNPVHYDGSSRRTTQAQVAYNELRRAITSGDLPGGAHIVQSEWADRLDVSITPIREAIRRLEQDGLAHSEAHKGTTVTQLTFEGSQEIYTLRHAVEPIQYRKANGRIAGTFEEARELCTEMNEVKDPVEFCDLDLRFHCILMGIDKSWTSRVTRFLCAAASPYITVCLHSDPKLMPQANEQHFQMIDAMESGDVETAIAINSQHLNQTLNVLRSVRFPICSDRSEQQ